MGSRSVNVVPVSSSLCTSMEVEVQFYSEDTVSGKRLKTSTAIVTYVALDQKGSQTQAPSLIPETDEEKQRYQAALRRREQRLG